MSKKRKVLAGLVSLTLWDIAAADAAPFNPYSWSGFYLGAHAGVRWANPSFSGPGYDFDTGSGVVTSPPRSESYNTGGGIVGVHTGYNYMITTAILAGI